MSHQNPTQQHKHNWVTTEVGCKCCGSHPAVMCCTEEICPQNYDMNAIDLMKGWDPRLEQQDKAS